jgi:hypothetical protein
MADNQEFNKEQARVHLGVSLRTLQRLTARDENEKDKIPFHRKPGKKGDETWYFKRDLDAYLAKRNPPVMMPGLAPDVPDVTPPDTALTRQGGADFLTALASLIEDRRRDDDRFLTLHEASEQFGVSQAVLRRGVAQGKLKLYPVGIRGAKVLRLSEIRGFIREL